MAGKIERVPLRDIWKHEAFDFTRWLKENIDVLNDSIGLSLSNAEREKSAGGFNVGLVAEFQKKLFSADIVMRINIQRFIRHLLMQCADLKVH